MALALVLARLEASRKVLQGVSGSSHFERHASWQLRAVQATLTEPFDDDDYVKVCAKIAEVGFPTKMEDELMNSVELSQMHKNGKKASGLHCLC